MKNLLKKAFLLLALIGGASSTWADEVIFSATPTATWSVPASTTDAEITSSYATISGGSMYLTNKQSSAKDMIKNQTELAFQHTNNDTFFKVVLSKALQAGDVISARMQSRKDADLGLWFSTASSRPGSVTAKIDLATAAAQEWVVAPTYTVQEGDGIIGETTFYIYRATGKSTYFNTFTITRAAVAPGAISFSPAAGSVAAGASVTLASSGASTIEYQWGASAIGEGGDWSGAVTYSGENKPVVPAAGSANTVLSVKATNANGSTYGSAAYTPVKMALKTIYSFADGIGSQEVAAATASVESPMSISNTAGRIILTAATGSQFKSGDAIEFSGSVGNTSKAYGIKYGKTTSLGTDLYVAAGQPCHVSGTLTLDAATGDLYIGRYDGTATSFTSFTIRQLTAATSEAFTGVKIGGSAATEDVDYTIDGSTITLTGTFTVEPNVALVNHIVFADESVEDQNLLVAFGAPNGEFYTGTVTIDGTTYTVKAPCGQINALKVVYKNGDTTIKEENIDVTGLKVGASYTVPFHMYVEKDGALYKTTANGSNPYYGDAVTLAYNTTVTKSLSPVDLGGGTLELLEDLDDTDGESANVRASNCLAYNNKGYTSANELTAGVYTFIVKAMNKGRGSSVKVGDTTAFTIDNVNATKGAWTDKTITNVVVPVAGNLTLAKGGSNTIDCYDIIIAIRTGEIATIGSMGYTTFSSSSPLNLDGIVGGTAYKVVDADIEGTVVTPSAVSGTIAAEEGLLLSGDAGATVTIPFAASGDAISGNLMKGCPNGATLNSSTPNYEKCYVLINGTTEAEFANLTNWISGGKEVEIPAGKAYLNTDSNLLSRELRISLFGGNITGIDQIDNGQLTIDNSQDGKFIENGKLVIVKNGVKYNAAGAKLY